MAKQSDGNVSSVFFGDCAFNHEVFNAVVRKDKRPKKVREELEASLAKLGWDASQGVAVIFDKTSKIWGPLHEKVLEDTFKERTATFEFLKSSSKDEDKQKLEVFQALFCDKGKVVKPRYCITVCTGRSESYFDSQVMRAKGFDYEGVHYDSKEPIAEIPAKFVVFSNEQERILCQVNENEKKVGQQEVSSLDKLRTVKYLVDTAGLTQAQARKLFTGTTGQKAWYLTKLDHMWSSRWSKLFPNEQKRPDLGLVERCFLPPSGNKDRYISFSSFNSGSIGVFVNLIDRSTPDGLDELHRKIDDENVKNRAAGKPVKSYPGPTTAEEVEEFVMGKKDSPQKVGLDKKNITEFAENSANDVVKTFANAVLTGNTTEVAKLTADSLVYNRVHELCGEGKQNLILLALSKLVMEHQHFSTFLEWASNGKPFTMTEEIVGPVEPAPTSATQS